MSEPRIEPGALRDLGLRIWLFSRLAGRVTGTGPARIFTTLGRRAGLDTGDIERVRLGSTASGWSDRHSLLLRVTESLLEHRDLDDHLWAELRAAEDERTTIELVMLVGHYDMLATTLNTLRVQPETPSHGGGR